MKFDLSTYLITDTDLCGDYSVAATVRDAIAAGATIVQVRDPEAEDQAFCAIAREVVAVASPIGVPVLLNDRAHLVKACGADGVHLGQDDMPIAEARALLGPEAIIGLSANEPDEFAAAQASGARIDYVGIGPVFLQQTKLDAPAPLGLEGLARRVTRSPWPVVAIGGIDAFNTSDVRRTGVAGVSVISAVCGRADPFAAMSRIVAAWRDQ